MFYASPGCKVGYVPKKPPKPGVMLCGRARPELDRNTPLLSHRYMLLQRPWELHLQCKQFLHSYLLNQGRFYPAVFLNPEARIPWKVLETPTECLPQVVARYFYHTWFNLYTASKEPETRNPVLWVDFAGENICLQFFS